MSYHRSEHAGHERPRTTGVSAQCGHKTPIIIVTAYPTEEHRTRALKDCATSFLIKPLDEQVLVDCLEQSIASPLSPPR